MGLKNVTSEALQEELDRRAKVLIVPYPFSSVQFEKRSKKLYRLCCTYITDLARDGHVDDDMENSIFETAMTAVFGDSVWDYVNEVLR